VLRAGPFSDERIVRRINRRFVPLYFDLDPGGALRDNKARAFVVKAKPELGRSAVGTPPVLVMTPDGDVLGEIDNYASEEAVLDALGDVLAAHPGWDEPSDEEQAISKSGSALERASLRFDLGDADGARALLEREGAPEAALLLAHLCRLAGEWDALEQALARVKGAAFADDVRVERAWGRLAAREFAAAEKLADAVPRASRRHTEARYVSGLSRWHAGRKDDALATWRGVIESCAQDPWIYRADWACTQATESGARTGFSTADARASPLGRIGYMGRRNPDLDPP